MRAVNVGLLVGIHRNGARECALETLLMRECCIGRRGCCGENIEGSVAESPVQRGRGLIGPLLDCRWFLGWVGVGVDGRVGERASTGL